ncbi:MAG: hypothetical protein LBS50_04065 [Prevotellaceae bacterium]|nr:hypothetical protein [Prevotellaceae bacterium]
MFKIVNYLKYRLLARHRKGFGVHSPFVFDLLNAVFFEENPFYSFEKTEKILKKQFSKTFFSKNIKYYRLIFRLANYFYAKKILILGKNPFVEQYFLSVSKTNRAVSICGLENLLKENLPQILEQNFKKLTNNKKNEPFDIIFFLTHNIIYYDYVITSPLFAENTILIFEGIYENPQSKAAWEHIKADEKTKICIDIYKYGIVFLKKDILKQSYLVKF